MHQSNQNAPATMVGAMYEIFQDMIFKALVIYIKYSIIFSDLYNKHVATLYKVLNDFYVKCFGLRLAIASSSQNVQIF